MRAIRYLFNYLASIRFTIVLIALSAISVIIGTIIESKTGSHKAAADVIYSSLFFALIIFGFFLNILLSLIKRWPFQKRHLPFMCAHIGLLMIISGTALKFSFGTQGYFNVKEGESVDDFFLNGTYGLSFKEKGQKEWTSLPLKSTVRFPLFSASLRNYEAHVKLILHKWIKDGFLFLLNSPPVPFNTVQTMTLDNEIWQVVAAKEEESPEAIKKLTKKPFLIFLEEKNKDVLAIATNRSGEVSWERYSDTPQAFYAYDSGFQGYSIGFRFDNKEIEGLLVQGYEKDTPPIKREDLKPAVSLDLIAENYRENVRLAFKTHLSQPVLMGKGLLRFEEQRRPLPYSIRLRQARALIYPNSSQPSGYEADLYFNNEPRTISMNNVYEDSSGYRYYLSNMTPLDQSKTAQVQIIVSRDPFKYTLTYPGSVLLALGMILLFKRKPFSN